MTVSSQLMTADELLRMPDDGFRYALVRGEPVRISPAGFQHGRIIMNIATPLDQHVRNNKLGIVCAAETGFVLTRNPDTVRAADVTFIAQAQLTTKHATEGYWPGAPDLVVEIDAPS